MTDDAEPSKLIFDGVKLISGDTVAVRFIEPRRWWERLLRRPPRDSIGLYRVSDQSWSR